MPPALSFRGQPLAREDTLGACLERVLTDPEIDSVTIVVAWARFGGLRRFKDRFLAFRKRGGEVRVILGIDEGIATVPGLTLAIEVASRAYVFHDRSRTFHPKIYLAKGSTKAVLLVGSSNMTAGGLYSNYEASLEAEFSLPAEAKDQALRGAEDYVTTLLGDKAVCRLLDKALLGRLIASPRYAIAGREQRSPNPPPKGIGSEELDGSGETGEAGKELFGSSKHKKPPIPSLSSGARKELRKLESPPAAPPSPPSGAAVPVATWTKVLPASDAQHPPSPGSNPLGNVRLTKAKHPIDWLTWFRHDLFGSAKWSKEKDRNGNDIETAAVVFAVTIAGVSHGPIELRVDHAKHRESKQANHATVLHWGPLGSLLRETDYTGYVLTLQRMSDGTYRLDISP